MTADLFSDQEGAPKRTYRPVAETLADVKRIREEDPNLSTADIARKLGYPPKYLYKLLSEEKKGETAEAGSLPTGKLPKPRADALVAKLCDPIAKLATAMMFAAPTVACVFVERGETTARALVAIAEGRPKMLAALENVSKVGPVTDLAETLICALIAASLDFGKMPPEHPLAVITGNTARYHKMHPEAAAEAARGPAPFPPFPFPVPGVPVA